MQSDTGADVYQNITNWQIHGLSYGKLQVKSYELGNKSKDFLRRI